jgi:hypothetical protein
MTPPNTIPMAPPNGAPAEKVANALLLALPGGKEWASIPIAAGTMAAVPIPWNARSTMSCTPVLVNAHPRETQVINRPPSIQTSFLPYKSARRPKSNRKQPDERANAETIQGILSLAIWSSCAIVGTAILTEDDPLTCFPIVSLGEVEEERSFVLTCRIMVPVQAATRIIALAVLL